MACSSTWRTSSPTFSSHHGVHRIVYHSLSFPSFFTSMVFCPFSNMFLRGTTILTAGPRHALWWGSWSQLEPAVFHFSLSPHRGDLQPLLATPGHLHEILVLSQQANCNFFFSPIKTDKQTKKPINTSWENKFIFRPIAVSSQEFYTEQETGSKKIVEWFEHINNFSPKNHFFE